MKNIKKRSNKFLVGLFIVCFSIIPLIGCSNNSLGNAKAKESLQSKSVTESIVVNEEQEQIKSEEVLITDTKDSLEENKLIEVDGGNQSGDREPNVVVDIGFGDREYYAFTNEYGQLVKVIAKRVTLQDDSTEPVTTKGRYYSDEAKVPGVESPTLDEGHVIADSLGGVSNAYNICPQNSTLNRHGDQAYMEKVIRDAGGCTDFLAVITYPNANTQIPSHYSFTYTLKGNVINDEFDNVNPDEVNAKLEETTKTPVIQDKEKATITPAIQEKEKEKFDGVTQQRYVGSTGSNKYHKPSCRYAKKINQENLIEFDSKEDAESKGYKPCGVCHP